MSRLIARLPWILLTVTLLLLIADTILSELARNASVQLVAGLPLILGFPLVGALVASRQPRNAVGWICLVIGLLLALPANEWATYALVTRHGTLPAGEVAGWLDNMVFPAVLFLIAFLIALFPDGRLPSRRWRSFARAAGIGGALWICGFAFGPGQLSNSFTWVNNPVGVPLPIGWVPLAVRGFGYFFLLIVLIGSAAALVRRLMTARGEVRQQLKWLASAGAILALSWAATTVASLMMASYSGPLATVLSGVFTASLFALPVAIGIAILKYRLYDIDIVINRAVVVGGLGAFITVVYVAIVVGFGALVGTAGKPNLALSILATAIVAVAFQAVREQVQRFANRLVYGKRATPYEVLSQFSDRIAEVFASEEVLARMARVVAEGTGASRADVWLRVGTEILPTACSPEPDGPKPEPIRIVGQLLPKVGNITRLVPVRHKGELLGALSINKAPGEALTPVEEKLLTDLAAQAGLVLRNVRLTAELQARLNEISRQAVELRASRQRIVAAQDAERRRLERDIHDGAQQHLVALTVKLRLAALQAKTNPARAVEAVRALQHETHEALQTLRDLARGIYPPILREQGLVAALRAQAEKMPRPAEISSAGMGRQPPEVEAAIYFCCLEALQNASKHSGASSVQLHLEQHNGQVRFSVIDSGIGFDRSRVSAGSGLQNMRDRVEALGGHLEVSAAPQVGTRVTGTIPAG